MLTMQSCRATKISWNHVNTLRYLPIDESSQVASSVIDHHILRAHIYNIFQTSSLVNWANMIDDMHLLQNSFSFYSLSCKKLISIGRVLRAHYTSFSSLQNITKTTKVNRGRWSVHHYACNALFWACLWWQYRLISHLHWRERARYSAACELSMEGMRHSRYREAPRPSPHSDFEIHLLFRWIYLHICSRY